MVSSRQVRQATADSFHWRVPARLTAWLRSRRSLTWWPFIVVHRRCIVTPLERLTHPSQPGRPWSHIREERPHGHHTHVSVEPEAAQRSGPPPAVRPIPGSR